MRAWKSSAGTPMKRGGGPLAPSVPEKVRHFIEEHGLFAPGERIGVAVSGGVDSVTLLHLLRGLEDYRLELAVFHVDHGLRPESAADAEFVRSLAVELGLPFFLARPAVKEHARANHLSPEMAARELRYLELARMAREAGVRRVALGHHRDDQVETVLLRIIRGTGLEGLSGMAPIREEGLFVRPLLAVGRGEILYYAGENGLRWVEDATNREIEIPRNRVRHVLLPLLRAEFNPQVDRALLGLAAIARETLSHLDGELSLRWPELGVEPAPAGVLFSGTGLSALPTPLARLAIRRLFARVGGDPGRLSLAACERIRRFAGGTGGARLCVPGGFVLARRGPVLFLGRQRIHPPLPPREIPVPGEVVLADGRRLLAEWWSGNLPNWTDVRESEAFIDADRIVWPLFVRSRRPGDRFYPLGLGGSKKIKDALIEAKVAREEREAVPVVVDGSGRIVWLAGLRLDERFRVTEETKRLLHLTLCDRD